MIVVDILAIEFLGWSYVATLRRFAEPGVEGRTRNRPSSEKVVNTDAHLLHAVSAPQCHGVVLNGIVVHSDAERRPHFVLPSIAFSDTACYVHANATEPRNLALQPQMCVRSCAQANNSRPVLRAWRSVANSTSSGFFIKGSTWQAIECQHEAQHTTKARHRATHRRCHRGKVLVELHDRPHR